jgi:uncharacterized membrane protein YcaP (DUF421 family)
MVVFRAAGKRSLAEITTFDLLMLLILSETTQQAMVGDDHSLTRAFILVLTWVGLDIAMSFVKQWWPWVERVAEGTPLVIVENGRPLKDRMRMERVDEGDILAAARRQAGIGRMEQIKYAVLETNGGISIIPREGDRG